MNGHSPGITCMPFSRQNSTAFVLTEPAPVARYIQIESTPHSAQSPTTVSVCAAGVMISTIPVAVLFTFLQKHLIKGLTAGAMKG